MIDASFLTHNNFYYSFEISGHANHSFGGNDIVCSAVSSAVDMTIGAIKDNNKNYILKINFDKAFVHLSTKDINDISFSLFVKALYNHLKNISAIYPHNIKVTINNRNIL